MKEIDHIGITIGKKPFGQYKVISQRAFNNDNVVLVTFQNQVYIWIPTWPEMGELIKALFMVENMNRVNRGQTELSFKEHLIKMGLEKEINNHVN